MPRCTAGLAPMRWYQGAQVLIGAEIEVDDLRNMGPAKLGNIGNRVLVTGQIGVLGQAVVQGGKGFIHQAPIARNG